MDANVNLAEYVNLFDNTMAAGQVVKPRGTEIRELEDVTITIDPRFAFMNFEVRRYNVAYFKSELMWKLGANKHDESIKAHAKMWESVQNPDGTFNSNYGQYWFGPQMGLMHAYLELVRDKDSRRAAIPMLQPHHMDAGVKDTVCTNAIAFRIRRGHLNMSVHMRSSDQIFGLGTDIPTFCVVYRMMHALLSKHYAGLQIGRIRLTAMSSHVYERHYGMVNSILAKPDEDVHSVFDMPWFECAEEVFELIAGRGKTYGFGKFADWLALP